jgi:hypothetical protein
LRFKLSAHDDIGRDRDQHTAASRNHSDPQLTGTPTACVVGVQVQHVLATMISSVRWHTAVTERIIDATPVRGDNLDRPVEGWVFG